MSFKFAKASTLALLALFDNQLSSNLVNASFTQVSQGVVRIELERKHINQESLQLDDTVEVEDKMFMFDKSGDPLNDKNLLIDLDESNYSSLRATQRKHLH
jgi:hypothetical protein